MAKIFRSTGPFPAGIILHSYLGSAEMVPELAKLGAYFSFSGFLMSMKEQKAKQMLNVVPSDRILLETDAPDALPNKELGSLILVDRDNSKAEESCSQGENSASNAGNLVASTLPKEMLNHPANIRIVLNYVASLLDMTKEELAELSYQNAAHLFSYEASKVQSS
uniref:Uncharacterized protein MANES_08G158200 n=1 Tax=Rhizophora mucronata TaxID=61149 RepID=A0A2P2JUE4_RHIMU